MFRTAAIRRLTHRLRALAIWAMVPLAALNVRTVSGCVCPDGHFEALCNAADCSGSVSDSTESVGTCGCSCCAHRSDKEGSADCCRKLSCCAGKSSGLAQDSGQDSISGRGCCRPASQLHVTSSVVVKSEVDVARPLELMTVDAAVSVQSLLAEVANHFDLTRAATCTAPDLVITLRKLVI